MAPFQLSLQRLFFDVSLPEKFDDRRQRLALVFQSQSKPMFLATNLFEPEGEVGRCLVELCQRLIEAEPIAAHRPDRVREYGTSEADAQPFFWPALRLLRKRLRNRINRAAKKAVKDSWNKQ